MTAQDRPEGNTEPRDVRRRLPGESDAAHTARMRQPTGRMIWLDCSRSEGAFASRAIPEILWHATAVIGEQSGTYFRSVRTHEGMTVWTWGGRDPETLAAIRSEASR